VVLPVLLLILFGILYFGRYESYSSQMTQLAEQGARAGAIDSWPTASYPKLADWVRSLASGELASGSSDVSKLGVTVVCSTSNCSGTNATVTVCLSSRVQFPVLGIQAGTAFQKATMRVENTSGTSPLGSTTSPAGPACS
jgi:Flp pilus assembly protein TadG